MPATATGNGYKDGGPGEMSYYLPKGVSSLIGGGGIPYNKICQEQQQVMVTRTGDQVRCPTICQSGVSSLIGGGGIPYNKIRQEQ